MASATTASLLAADCLVAREQLITDHREYCRAMRHGTVHVACLIVLYESDPTLRFDTVKTHAVAENQPWYSDSLWLYSLNGVDP